MAASEPDGVTPLELLTDLLRGSDERIAITGATGWIGATALDLMYDVFEGRAPDRVTAYASAGRDVTVRDGRHVKVIPLSELASQSPAPTTLLHFAFLTRDRAQEVGFESYVSQNVGISATVLGAVARHRPRSVVVASSGAVYGPGGSFSSALQRDPYGALKRLDELAFRQATRDVGGTCVVPRIFSVAGPRMTKPEAYALGSMIRMAVTGGPIEVRARGRVVRSYCGVDEVVALAVWAAITGRDGEFDSSGTVVEMSDLARVVASVHGLGDRDVVRERDAGVAEDVYVGDPAQMPELAASAGMRLQSLESLVRSTSAWLARSVGTGAVPAGEGATG